jgi:hypothetical protein
VGQTIQIEKTVETGNVLLVSTDRSFTGQDGESFTGPVSAGAVDTFGARLAVALFGADPSIDHVYVMSNALSIRRRGGWPEEAVSAIVETISGFFRFYRQEEEQPAAGT